jgi:hypothetical protein
MESGGPFQSRTSPKALVGDQGPPAAGSTPSEKYLAGLCEKAFLTLWAYPNVYTDEGRSRGKGAGKELCDLLVVFGDDVVVFSDKHCEYKDTGDDSVDWKRWYRRAIQKSVNQLAGAASFVERFPHRLFLDRDCSTPLPRTLPRAEKRRFHLVAVTRGSREACERFFAGQSIGSLRFIGDLCGDSAPFSIGPIWSQHGLVHVFDEHTLDAVFAELDTVADFVQYLSKREALARRVSPIVMADGEEQLLARYLKSMVDGEHDFAIEALIDGQPVTMVYISEGEWEAYVKNPQYLSKKSADEVSYFWDELIERFARLGRPDLVPLPGLRAMEDTEPALREMAAESRFSRRILAGSLVDLLQRLTPDQARTRVFVSPSTEERAYVFLAAPFRQSEFASYDEYRQSRAMKLAAYVSVAREGLNKSTDQAV